MARSSRRGRRAYLPEDVTPYSAAHVDVGARVAWLLRVHRLLSPVTGTGSLAEFARLLAGAGVTADPARVSQWETAAIAVGPDVVTAYERVLGLVPGQLLAVVEGLEHSVLAVARRTGAGTGSTGPAGQRRLDDVYDRIADGEGSGGDWLSFAHLMGGRTPVLVPGRIVQSLADRLVDEMTRSVGIAYVTRFEALCRLAASPPSSGAVVRGVSATVGEPGAQSILDAMTLYGEVPDPAVVAMLVRTAGTDSGRHRLGAFHALLNMVLLRTLPAGSEPAVEALVVQLLAERGDPAAQSLGRRLAERLDPPARLRVARRSGVAVGPAVPTARRPHERPAVLGEYAADAAAVTGIDADPMLARLLHEFLAGDFVERAHHAALFMLVSPYRAELAGTALRVVETRATHPDAESAAGLLTYLADARDAPRLAALLPTVPTVLRPTLLQALAHAAPGPLPVDLAALREDPGVGTSSLLYAAGMSGDPLLDVVARDGTEHADRLAARWWRGHGPAVRN